MQAPRLAADSLARPLVVLGVLGLLAAAVCAVAPVRLAVERLAHPEIASEYGESILMVGAEDLRREGLSALYPSAWDDPPLRVNPYPPTMYALWAGLAALLDGRPDHLPGRVVAAAGWILLVAMLYAIPLRLGVRRVLAAASALAFLSSPMATQWIAVARVDVPGLALGLLGLWLLIPRNPAPGGRVRATVAALVFAASLGFKQSLLAAPAAGILYLVAARRGKEAALVTGVLVAIGGLVFFVLDAITSGGFARNAVGSVMNPMHPAAGVAKMLGAVSRPPLPGVALLAALPLVLLGWSAGRRPATLYLGLALVLSAATISKVGANTNYLVEPVAALFLAAPVGLEALGERAGGARGVRLLVALGALGLGASAWVERDRVHQVLIATRRFPQILPSALSLDVPADAGFVLMNPGIVPLSGVPVTRLYWNDPYTFSSYAAFGVIDAGRVRRHLEDGTIGVIVENHPLESPPPGAPRFPGDFENGWGPWWVDPWLAEARASFRREPRPPGFFVYRFAGAARGPE